MVYNLYGYERRTYLYVEKKELIKSSEKRLY